MDFCLIFGFADDVDFWEKGKFGPTTTLQTIRTQKQPKKTPREPNRVELGCLSSTLRPLSGTPMAAAVVMMMKMRRMRKGMVGDILLRWWGKKNNCSETKIRFLKFPEKPPVSFHPSRCLTQKNTTEEDKGGGCGSEGGGEKDQWKGEAGEREGGRRGIWERGARRKER